MNDRFKFRFWDKDKKIIIDENSDYNTIESIYGKDEWWWCVEASMPTVLEYFEQQSCWDGKKDFVIMQCTGLKDKNGKLIYEGDVIAFMNPFENDKLMAFTVNWESTLCITGFNLGEEFAKNVEVIGNIYENPELLKECE